MASNQPSSEYHAEVNSNANSTDCLACRLTSGGGVIAAGLYVGYHGRRQPTYVGRMIVSSVSFALCCLGTCRLLNLPPFGKRTSLQEIGDDHNNSKNSSYNNNL